MCGYDIKRQRWWKCGMLVYTMCVYLSVTQTALYCQWGEPTGAGAIAWVLSSINLQSACQSCWWLCHCVVGPSLMQGMTQELALYHPTVCMTRPLLPSCLILYTSLRPHSRDTHFCGNIKLHKKGPTNAQCTLLYSILIAILLVIFAQYTSLLWITKKCVVIAHGR